MKSFVSFSVVLLLIQPFFAQNICKEYTSKNGLVIMEMENTTSEIDPEFWIFKTNIEGYSGNRTS